MTATKPRLDPAKLRPTSGRDRMTIDYPVKVIRRPGVVEAAAAELDDEADDWEDAIDALILALDELDGHVEAAWDPTKHARNPKGSPGGGRFRSMVDRLKDAIDVHRKGGGKGHPFDGFDREQLRRVARKRGIQLKRGEDRDSIAEKLLQHLGKGAPEKVVAPPVKKATPRKPKAKTVKPVTLTPEQQLEQWRADAANPGRIRLSDSGPTKRELYVKSWDESIARTRREIAEAEAAGHRHRLPDLHSTLDWQKSARESILKKRDPDLEKPASGPRFKLAQQVDPARPLAVYGDVLHMDSADDDWIRLNMVELEKIPAHLHRVVAEHLAAKESGGIWLGDTGVSDMNHSHDLKHRTPRGWGDGKTFDDVNGVYRPDQRVLLIGRTANSGHRGERTASHEFGHALDHALDTPSGKPDWEAIHNQALTHQHLSPYYRQEGHAGAEEFWAEAFSAWVTARHRKPGYDTIATYIMRLVVSGELGQEIHEYFDRLVGDTA